MIANRYPDICRLDAQMGAKAPIWLDVRTSTYDMDVACARWETNPEAEAQDIRAKAQDLGAKAQDLGAKAQHVRAKAPKHQRYNFRKRIEFCSRFRDNGRQNAEI